MQITRLIKFDINYCGYLFAYLQFTVAL